MRRSQIIDRFAIARSTTRQRETECSGPLKTVVQTTYLRTRKLIGDLLRSLHEIVDGRKLLGRVGKIHRLTEDRDCCCIRHERSMRVVCPARRQSSLKARTEFSHRRYVCLLPVNHGV